MIRIFIALTLLLLLLTSQVIWGQGFNDVIEKSLQENDISKQLPPISELQDSAVIHSPLLKIYDSDIVIQKLKIKSEKREWMHSLGFEAGAKYGLFDNLILKEDLGIQDVATSTTEQTRYNLGFFLKIPLSSIYDKSNIRIAKEEVDKLRYQKQESVLELRQLIVQYNNVIRAHKNLIIRTSDVESYKVQMLRADKDLENGLINIAEYARLRDMLSRATLGLEDSKVEFITALQLLQETVGIRIILNRN